MSHQWQYTNKDGIRPPFTTKQELYQIVRKPSLVEELARTAKHSEDPACQGWLVLGAGGDSTRHITYSTDSVERSMARLAAGEMPPKYPSKAGRLRSWTRIAAERIEGIALARGLTPMQVISELLEVA